MTHWKRMTLVAGLALCTALPASALDLNNLSPEEKQGLNAQIRAYLLENPEVVMEAIDALRAREAAEQTKLDRALVQTHANALFEDPNSWVGGNPDGDITIVEFVDYRCSYCRKAHDVVTKLVEMDGNIRLVMKEYPVLSEESVISARFAVAALMIGGPDAYAKAHDALIKLQGPMPDAVLKRVAKLIGMEAEPLLEKMDSDEVRDVLVANRELGSLMQIAGTPSFVIGPEMARGYLELPEMQYLVDAARAGTD